MTFRALNDRVLVKADSPPEKVGSIYLTPGTARAVQQKRGRTGIVRFIGPGIVTMAGERFPMADVKVGDRVIFLDQPWPETEIAGEKLLSMRDDVILAVVENAS